MNTNWQSIHLCVYFKLDDLKLLVVDKWISIDFHNKFFMENEMFLHILMILYRFFMLFYNTILDNKIYNLINAHEVQTASLKKGWWERKTMSKNMEIWLLNVGSTWTTMLHANKWLSWRTEMSFMNLSIGNLRNYLLFFSYYYIHHHNVRALSPLVVLGGLWPWKDSAWTLILFWYIIL